MVMNKTLLWIILLVFIFANTNISAQQTGESQNRVVRTEDGLSISQIIFFPAVENVLRYEIEIEIGIEQSEQDLLEDQDLFDEQDLPEMNFDWVLIHKLDTAENFFEVSLKAGEYRYRITAYNRMNLIEGISEWQNFQIIGTSIPNIESYQPFYGMFLEMPGADSFLIIHGSGLSDKTEFALVRERNYDWTDVNIEEHKNTIIPDSIEITDDQARLTFTRGSIRQGTYGIFARNPGGLWVSFGQVRAKYQNKIDYNFEFGYSPIIGNFENDDFYWDSFYFSFGFYPIKTRIGNFGLGMRAFVAKDYFFPAINILYQYAFSERFQHNARLFFFPSWIYSEDYTGEYPRKEEETCLNFNLGYTIQYFILKNIYLAAGIDFFFRYNLDSDDRRFGVNPQIGLGFQLGRWGEQAEVIERARRGEDYSVPVTIMPRGEHLLSIGWSPMIPIAGIDLYSTVFNHITWEYEQGDQQLRVFNPLGFNIRYAYFPHRWNRNKLGIGFEFAILDHINRTLQDNEEILILLDLLSHFFIQINYQRIISEKWQINAHTGFGISNSYNYNAMNYNGPVFAVNIGAQVQYFLWKNAFVEAGLNIICSLAETNPIIIIRPGISIGWQFRRGTETGLRLPGTGLPHFGRK